MVRRVTLDANISNNRAFLKKAGGHRVECLTPEDFLRNVFFKEEAIK